MKLRHLIIDRVMCYGENVEVDFASLPSGIIAVCGANGVGKSALCESSGPAPLFREMPTRTPPSLDNWVQPGGGVELTFEARGSEWQSIVRKGKAKNAGMEAILYRDGDPKSSGRTRDFDQAIKLLIGTKEAFYAGPFAMQGGKGRFADSKSADRRALFRHYLGLHALDEVVEMARRRLRDLDRDSLAELGNELALAIRGLTEAESLSQKAEHVLNQLRGVAEKARRDLQEVAHNATDARARGAYEEALQRAVAAQRYANQLLPAPPVDQAEATLDQTRIDHSKWVEETRTQRALKDELKRLEAQHKRIQQVPCKGEGKYATCPLLQDAIEAGPKKVEVLENLMHRGEPGNQPNIKEATEALKLARDIERAKINVDTLKEEARRLRRLLPDQLPDKGAAADFDMAERRVKMAEEALDRQTRRTAEYAAHVTQANEHLLALRKKEKGAAPILRDCAALELIMRGFGPQGVQALLIDAAGPQVSNVANELLDACYGRRYRVELRTQKQSAGKDRMLEDLDLHVLDEERGVEGLLGSFSGGQGVIVDEALRVALCLFSMRGASGQAEVRTMWRDELTSRLYDDNVQRHADMLRRAVKLGGFERVLFVGGEEAADAADAVLTVKNGRVERTA